MADMLDLAKFMDKLLPPIATLASNAAAASAIAIINDLVQVTPADTGSAVSNWQVTLDAPAPSILPPFIPSPKGRMIKGVWVHLVAPDITARANASFVLDAAYVALRSKAPGQIIFITNNLEYIQKLNQGSSLQSPAGFVDRALIISSRVVGQTRFQP